MLHFLVLKFWEINRLIIKRTEFHGGKRMQRSTTKRNPNRFILITNSFVQYYVKSKILYTENR